MLTSGSQCETLSQEHIKHITTSITCCVILRDTWKKDCYHSNTCFRNSVQLSSALYCISLKVKKKNAKLEFKHVMPVCHWCKRGIHNTQISSILIVSYSVRLKFCAVACAYHLMAKILSIMLVSHWGAWTACVQIVVDHLLKWSYDYFEMRSIVDLVVSDCFHAVHFSVNCFLCDHFGAGFFRL